MTNLCPYPLSVRILQPSLGGFVRKYFHDFRNHFLIALIAKPAKAPLVVAA